MYEQMELSMVGNRSYNWTWKIPA
ncbi:hypothetical protein OOU_Y34scaffold00594g27 [Pyricularia oryzae Y34]|uniref:Uncharacterized protein n=2 Tax=Pyricularia oryzae TaxID=318829 RepID=A0AA97PJZ0_PYRO3|nr:hypothetical protein OOU_Y34scaffold00594g27 [Pyricularia oryzae Y34]